MVCGMAIMTYRKTFALDKETSQRLKTLSSAWNISQAEVVRRAVGQAAKSPSLQLKNPAQILKGLHDHGQGLTPEVANSYLSEVTRDREAWRNS